ncbi:MAG TPA: hypothetical protein VGV92_00245 [Gammaproteobacteria bacterium]|nr:hypothetical protein [Gammaproteobacteria bacterium]
MEELSVDHSSEVSSEQSGDAIALVLPPKSRPLVYRVPTPRNTKGPMGRADRLFSPDHFKAFPDAELLCDALELYVVTAEDLKTTPNGALAELRANHNMFVCRREDAPLNLPLTQRKQYLQSGSRYFVRNPAATGDQDCIHFSGDFKRNHRICIVERDVKGNPQLKMVYQSAEFFNRLGINDEEKAEINGHRFIKLLHGNTPELVEFLEAKIKPEYRDQKVSLDFLTEIAQAYYQNIGSIIQHIVANAFPDMKGKTFLPWEFELDSELVFHEDGSAALYLYNIKSAITCADVYDAEGRPVVAPCPLHVVAVIPYVRERKAFVCPEFYCGPKFPPILYANRTLLRKDPAASAAVLKKQENKAEALEQVVDRGIEKAVVDTDNARRSFLGEHGWKVATTAGFIIVGVAAFAAFGPAGLATAIATFLGVGGTAAGVGGVGAGLIIITSAVGTGGTIVTYGVLKKGRMREIAHQPLSACRFVKDVEERIMSGTETDTDAEREHSNLFARGVRSPSLFDDAGAVQRFFDSGARAALVLAANPLSQEDFSVCYEEDPLLEGGGVANSNNTTKAPAATARSSSTSSEKSVGVNSSANVEGDDSDQDNSKGKESASSSSRSSGGRSPTK